MTIPQSPCGDSSRLASFNVYALREGDRAKRGGGIKATVSNGKKQSLSQLR